VVPILFLEKKFKECEKGDDITPFDGITLNFLIFAGRTKNFPHSSFVAVVESGITSRIRNTDKNVLR
jgi:hypothetical protein